MDAANVDALVCRSVALANTGPPEKALRDCQRALDLQPASAEAWVAKGLVCMAGPTLGEAAACFQRATEVAPTLALLDRFAIKIAIGLLAWYAPFVTSNRTEEHADAIPENPG